MQAVSSSRQGHTMRYTENETRGQTLPGVNESDIRQAFRLIDLDQDGQISARDLRIYLETIGEQPTYGEINEMIRMADQGKTGFVHLLEFTDLFFECNKDGSENAVYEDCLPQMTTLRSRLSTATKMTVADTAEEIVKRFISKVPGAMAGSSWIRRDVLRDIIGRWKSLKLDMLSEKHFFELLRMKRTDYGERAFAIFSGNRDKLDVKQFILIMGVFVAAPCEERIDFACRVLDEANTGLLVQEQVEAILQANFVGVKTDLRIKVDRIMQESDSSSLINRKQLMVLAKNEPAFMFPPGRTDNPADLGSYRRQN